jgi:hypothetical protein
VSLGPGAEISVELVRDDHDPSSLLAPEASYGVVVGVLTLVTVAPGGSLKSEAGGDVE